MQSSYYQYSQTIFSSISNNRHLQRLLCLKTRIVHRQSCCIPFYRGMWKKRTFLSAQASKEIVRKVLLLWWNFFQILPEFLQSSCGVSRLTTMHSQHLNFPKILETFPEIPQWFHKISSMLFKIPLKLFFTFSQHFLKTCKLFFFFFNFPKILSKLSPSFLKFLSRFYLKNIKISRK